ncbi:MAG: hypothetical protein ACREOI_18110 [bacterium]
MNERINVHAIIQKGERIYSRRLKAKLEKKYFGKIVAIDPDTGEYFIGDTILEAVKKGRKKHPGTVFHSIRVGYPAAHWVKEPR